MNDINKVVHTCNKEREIGMIIQKLDDFSDDMGDFKTEIRNTLNEFKNEIKSNSEFRLKATTIVGFVAFISAAFGAFLIGLLSKISNISKILNYK